MSRKIADDQIKKGRQYSEKVKPRLLALVRLNEMFSYTPIFYRFSAKIEADYLRHSKIEPGAFGASLGGFKRCCE